MSCSCLPTSCKSSDGTYIRKINLLARLYVKSKQCPLRCYRLILLNFAVAEVGGQSNGSPVQAGSRMGAPSRETLQISPSYIAANAAAIQEGYSTSEDEREPAKTQQARILFAFDPDDEVEVAVTAGEDVQVRNLGCTYQRSCIAGRPASTYIVPFLQCSSKDFNAVTIALLYQLIIIHLGV